jgi:DNA-binding winged helix-turn-helix (wHTH) protein/TolB-like protein/Tfp pilus assembly protein PilF
MTDRGAGSVIRFGDFELDLEREWLGDRHGAEVHLPPKPYQVLRLLVSRAGELVTRDELRRAVWGEETFVDFEHALNTCVRQVREVLGDDAQAPRYLATVPRRGYRFVAAVERVERTERAEPASAPEAASGGGVGRAVADVEGPSNASPVAAGRLVPVTASGSLAAEPPREPPAPAVERGDAPAEDPAVASDEVSTDPFAGDRYQAGDTGAALAFAAAMLVGVLAIWIGPRPEPLPVEPWQAAGTFLPRWGEEGLRPRPSAGGSLRSLERPVRVAVLPLETASGDPAEQALALGFAEELVSRLASLDPERIAVVSRTSVGALVARQLAPPEIARELDAALLVEGSLQRERGKVRLRVRLVDALDQSVHWSTVFDRSEGEVLATQQEVASRVAGSLGLRVALAGRRSPAPPAAAQLAYLRARALLVPGLGTETLAERYQRAGVELDQALALAPEFAAAWAARAELLALRPLAAGPLDPAKDAAAVVEAAERALALDPSQAGAHFALAVADFYFRWDLPAAAVSFERALALSPGNPRIRHWYAGWFAASGRPREALALIEDAVLLDPFSRTVLLDAGFFAYFAGEHAMAERVCERLVALAPEGSGGWTCLAAARRAGGDLAGALAAKQRELGALGVSADRVAEVGGLDLETGWRRAAELAVEQTLRAGGPATFLAANLVVLERRDEAFGILEMAVAWRDPWALFLGVDPRFASLRTDPRFGALLVRGMPGYVGAR